MKILTAMPGKLVDIRRVRHLIGKYITYWRKVGKQNGWPEKPTFGAAKNPAQLVRKFRKDVEYRTRRQRNWHHRISKTLMRLNTR